MIRRLLIVIALVPLASWAHAAEEISAAAPAPRAEQAPAPTTDEDLAPLAPQADAAPPPPVDTSIETHRSAFDALVERMIGTASKPVRFDWRRSDVGFALTGSHVGEANNFRSANYGALVRTPMSGFVGSFGVLRVETWDTRSSRMLALTPYRQHGRASRFELELGLGFPLAEGVVTAWPSFFPAAQMVFTAHACFRYAIYPSGYAGGSFWQVLGSIFSPQLADWELRNLDDHRLDAMAIDSARYDLLLGVSTDIYFQSGIFLSPRALVSPGLISLVTQSRVLFTWELGGSIGWVY